MSQNEYAEYKVLDSAEIDNLVADYVNLFEKLVNIGLYTPKVPFELISLIEDKKVHHLIKNEKQFSFVNKRNSCPNLILSKKETNYPDKLSAILNYNKFVDTFSGNKDCFGFLPVQETLKEQRDKLKEGSPLIILDNVKTSEPENVEYNIKDSNELRKKLSLLKSDSLFKEYYQDIVYRKGILSGPIDSVLEFAARVNMPDRDFNYYKSKIFNFMTWQQWGFVLNSCGFKLECFELLVDRSYYWNINGFIDIPEYKAKPNKILIYAKAI